VNFVKINKCDETANINVKNFQFKTVCNGDTAYITQIKQQKSKRCYLSTSEHVDIMAICCQSDSTFLIFAALVVWCTACRRYRLL